MDYNTIISLTALLVSFVAAVYTIKTFWLKTGCKIRYWLSYRKTFESEDLYVRELVIENMKDKAITVYNIYIRFGHNIYIDLLSHPKDIESTISPIIIPPYEIKVFTFYPQVLYTTQTNERVLNIGDMFAHINDAKIILSTNYGRITAKKSLKGWNPYNNYWNNYYTTIVTPQRLCYDGITYKDVAYGTHIQYLAIITLRDNTKIKCPIYRIEDPKVNFFAKIDFSEESLKDQESLYDFLEEQKRKNLIDYNSIEIIDMRSTVDTLLNTYKKETNVRSLNWFQYKIYGPIITIYIEWKRRRKKKH